MNGGHAMAISNLKGRSWGMIGDIVRNAVDPRDYLRYDGSEAAGLRMASEISKRKHILLWEFHEQAFGELPIRLVGRNLDMHGVTAARDWDDLKHILSRYRFFVHAADPRFEDGYNMATLEAMAAGLPVLGNRHPTSPVKHGVSGYLSDDPQELRGYAERLLQDRELAAAMGAQARRIVTEKFSMLRFAQRFRRSISIERKRWRKRRFDAAV
jgi:glycosyltransferase involved in cell wall biosynthesis